jgi:hypothetical protein
MKELAVLCIALCVSLSTTGAFARGGGHSGSHHSSSTGGAAGTSVSSLQAPIRLERRSHRAEAVTELRKDRLVAPTPSSTVTRRKLTR